MITTVSKIQFFTAIQAVGGMDVVNQGINADANTAVWNEFNAATTVQMGDPLYVATQLALGYTSGQMETLFAAAVQVPV